MKKQIKLNYINNLKDRISSGQSRKDFLIQVLLGPRQVGKTTSILMLIEENFKNNSLYFSADRVFNSNSQWLMDCWHQAEREDKILFIDEIQKCENWAETLKVLYDKAKRQKQQIRCVLLGSSSLEIHKGLTESLTGRFQLTQAFHWNYAESQQAYGLSFNEYLKFGGYPGSYPYIKTQDEWSDYVKNSIINTVVEKDILQFQAVRSPALFRQAFEILTAYPAQEISYTKLLGQIQDKGNVELIKNYIRLYEGAFLIKTLEKYSEKKINIKSSSPKIIPLAPCLYFLNVLAEYESDELGRVFELVVGMQLVRTNYDLYYWREGNLEVDYVLKIGRQVYAIEVKSGRKKSVKSLTAFQTKFSNTNVVYITKENYFDFEKNPIEFLRLNST